MSATRFILAFVFVFAAYPVWACRCLEPANTARAYRNAAAVVRASVSSVEGVGDSPTGAQAVITVKEAWKTDITEELKVSTSTTCAFDFHPDSEYLLYLYPGSEKGQWITRICVGNRPVTEAAKSLNWLRRHARKASIQRNQ